MIVHNKVNVQGELANKPDDRTVSYKHPTRRMFVQITYWCLCDYSIPAVEVKHI